MTTTAIYMSDGSAAYIDMDPQTFKHRIETFAQEQGLHLFAARVRPGSDTFMFINPNHIVRIQQVKES